MFQSNLYNLPMKSFERGGSKAAGLPHQRRRVINSVNEILTDRDAE